MTTIDPDQFESRWEFSKATSRYHFDPTVNEDLNPPYRKIGRFEGNWGMEVRHCCRAEKVLPITFENRLAFNSGELPYTDRLDKHDMNAMGVESDRVLYHGIPVPKDKLKLWSMVNFLAMEEVKVSIHCQLPGQVFFWHIDNLTGLRDNKHDVDIAQHPERAARFEIALADWVPGHVWAVGNTYWKQWVKGELVWHSWQDTPHGTANLSSTPRYTLQVTGLTTARTWEIINSSGLIIPV